MRRAPTSGLSHLAFNIAPGWHDLGCRGAVDEADGGAA
jgi:hypothetical protein